MIVVDTSALMAILEEEPDAARFAAILADAPRLVIGAPTRFEFGMVAISRKRAEGLEVATALLEFHKIDVLEWDDNHAAIALEAFTRFGKGHHSARLNFGDCMAYALAKSLGAPLLFKGGDFAQTDIEAAL